MNMRKNFIKNLALHSFLLILTLDTVHAATVKLNPADQIKLESLSLKCSKPGQECPKLPAENIEDVVYLETGDEYTIEHTVTVKEHGLLVSYKNESHESKSNESVDPIGPLFNQKIPARAFTQETTHQI